MDTSKAFQQYLIDKMKKVKKGVKVVSIGGIVLTVCCGAVAVAAKGVLTVVNTMKK